MTYLTIRVCSSTPVELNQAGEITEKRMCISEKNSRKVYSFCEKTPIVIHKYR